MTKAVSEAWGVTIEARSDAIDPQSFAAFAALFAHARSEQIIRALSHRTNLVLPGARVLIVGGGPIAETISTTLSRVGSRITRASDDPITLLRAKLLGCAVRSLYDQSADLRADHVIATGEEHPPLEAATAHGILIDASPDGTGFLAAASTAVDTLARPHVHRVAGSESLRVAAPAVFPTELGAATPLELHLIDLLVALSILTLHSDDASADLAELVLA